MLSSLSKIFLIRQLRARPRLALAVLAGVFSYLLIPNSLIAQVSTRLIVSWNVTACLYLLLGGIMIARSDHAQIRRRALAEDEGQWVILVAVVCAALASLAAILVELVIAKQVNGTLKATNIGLVALSIMASWAFTHTMFAFHYAHDFYLACARGKSGGLTFPDDDEPDYTDFLYFAFVIGTSGQTADVAFSSKAMRRVGLVHCVLAFFFNTTVLALTINIAASLI
jgi:uncharacterized membrane protein